MNTNSILDAFVKNWWVLLIRGILALLFAVMAFTAPVVTLFTLVLIFGFYAIADGFAAVWAGAAGRVWQLVVFGVIGIIAGAATFILPGVTAFALLYLIAAWALVRGVFDIVTAIQLRREISGEWVFIVNGVLSIVFGLLLAANPASGALALVWVVGAYAFIVGLMMIAAAFWLRGLPKHVEKFA